MKNKKYYITIGNKKIYNETKVKYLGLWLDYNLTWNTQAKHIIDKINKKIND